MPKKMNKDELLAEYQKISESFDQFTQLIRREVGETKSPGSPPDPSLDDYLNNSKNASRIEYGSNAPRKDVWEVLRDHGINPLESFPTAVIARLEDIGRAQQKLKMILDEDIFDDLSKHSTYWDHTDENVSDKLYDIRMKLSCLNDNLWDLWSILRREEE